MNNNFIWWRPDVPQSIEGTYQGSITSSYDSEIFIIKTASGNVACQGGMISNEMHAKEGFSQGDHIKVEFLNWAKGKSDKPYRYIQISKGQIQWVPQVKQYKRPVFCSHDGKEISDPVDSLRTEIKSNYLASKEALIEAIESSSANHKEKEK